MVIDLALIGIVVHITSLYNNMVPFSNSFSPLTINSDAVLQFRIVMILVFYCFDCRFDMIITNYIIEITMVKMRK